MNEFVPVHGTVSVAIRYFRKLAGGFGHIDQFRMKIKHDGSLDFSGMGEKWRRGRSFKQNLRRELGDWKIPDILLSEFIQHFSCKFPKDRVVSVIAGQ